MPTAYRSHPLTLARTLDAPAGPSLATFLATHAERRECLSCGVHTFEAAACRNCGKPASGLVCNEWHTLCDDCGIACRTCGDVGCVVCGNIPCRNCAARATAPA